MNEQLITLLQDEKIAAQLQQAQSPQAAYDIIKDKTDLSFDEFAADMRKMTEAAQQQGDDCLKDSDLENMAAGIAGYQPDAAWLHKLMEILFQPKN